jgi:feruloyl-CoA synthase
MELFAAPDIERIDRPDGTILLRSRTPLPTPPRSVGVWLEAWAERAPERTFLAERGADGAWRRVAYREARDAARSIGQALLDRGLSAERPLMILSENGIDHALLMFGAMHVGVPVVPVSTAYSRLSRDFAKLRHIAEATRPGLVYARSPEVYGKALAAIDWRRAEIVTGGIERLAETRPTSAVEAAFAFVGPETVAKILFTSGSTGQPKGVVNTQGMLLSNQEMIAAVWPALERKAPVIVDWLPWNHTFGGNHNINIVLRNGGTMYVDEGKPAPGLVEKTARNLREVSPTIYFNVPRGYAMLLDHLERDEALATSFFRDLDIVFYAGAALPQSLWERIEALARKTGDGRVPAMISSWGLTETAPMATAVHYRLERAGNVGVPAPGCALKLVPTDGKLEMRVRGPNVTPGYWRDAARTRAAFDEEGFYLTGDAARPADPADPNGGVIFDGRLGENFKLSSGTWVNVGELRVAAIAAGAPVIEDCVVAGHDRDEVTLLIFPSLAGCRTLCPHLPADAPAASLLAESAVRAALAAGLRAHNARTRGSSMRIARALLMAEPPSIDANEITDKGYLNQRAVLTRRATLVERLYVAPADGEIVVVDPAGA